MLALANAKINLGLLLTEKRTDGYHNLETVFYAVKLHDVVEMIDAEHTYCTVKGLAIPNGETDNLCLSAFKLLQAVYDLPHQHLILLKNIPIGAGLGGGSADAAFVLKLTNEKFNLGLSTEELQNYARELGADCAFFIENKPTFAYGKGDQFSPIELDLSHYYFVLVKPELHVSTALAYQNVKVAKPTISLKDAVQLPLSEWKYKVVNDFEPSVCAKFPQIDVIKTKLYAAGATFALMSGSGSSVYAIFESPVSLPELEKENKVFYGI